MALTIAADSAAYNYPYGAAVNLGPYKVVPVKITFDSSYPTGGESVRVSGSPVDSREKIAGFVVTGADAAGSAAYNFYYIPSTEKLMAMVGASGVNVEATNTADLSAIIVYGYFLVWG